eukprot:3206022-Prymnesium_polylepis.5
MSVGRLNAGTCHGHGAPTTKSGTALVRMQAPKRSHADFIRRATCRLRALSKTHVTAEQECEQQHEQDANNCATRMHGGYETEVARQRGCQEPSRFAHARRGRWRRITCHNDDDDRGAIRTGRRRCRWWSRGWGQRQRLVSVDGLRDKRRALEHGDTQRGRGCRRANRDQVST